MNIGVLVPSSLFILEGHLTQNCSFKYLYAVDITDLYLQSQKFPLSFRTKYPLDIPFE